MSKKAPPPTRPSGSFWLTFAVSGLGGALIGVIFTLVVLRPGPPPSPAGAVPSLNPDPTTHRPAPELTAGQTPAQADRTLGNFHYDHQDWPKAITHYESAIRQGSDDADIRTDLGNAYRFTGRLDDALAQYHRARQMNPSHEFSLFNQGGLYLEDLKQPAKAIEIWQEYLVRFPNGRSVMAARQLIAQAQVALGVPVSSPASAARPAAGQTSAAEALILERINAGQNKGGKP